MSLKQRNSRDSEVVGFPYSYFPAPQLSVDTASIITSAGISSYPSTSQHWIDVRPLSPPSQPPSPSWIDVRPLNLVSSSSASIFSSQSRSSFARETLSELRTRFRSSISFSHSSSRSRPPSMVSDVGSVSTISGSSGPSTPLSETAPSPTVTKMRPISSPISSTIGTPYGLPTIEDESKLKRYTAFDEPAPGWARVMAEKDDLVWTSRQLLWEDVVDTEDRVGAMIYSLNAVSSPTMAASKRRSQRRRTRC